MFLYSLFLCNNINLSLCMPINMPLFSYPQSPNINIGINTPAIDSQVQCNYSLFSFISSTVPLPLFLLKRNPLPSFLSFSSLLPSLYSLLASSLPLPSREVYPSQLQKPTQRCLFVARFPIASTRSSPLQSSRFSSILILSEYQPRKKTHPLTPKCYILIKSDSPLEGSLLVWNATRKRLIRRLSSRLFITRSRNECW